MIQNTFPGLAAVTLVRQYDARVLDISCAGCLIEVDAALAPGTVGTLELAVGGSSYREAVRVARVVPPRDAVTRTQVGLEFLVVTPQGADSIRTVFARLAAGAELTLTFVH